MPDSAGFGPVVMNPISSEVTREVCERGCGALAVLGLPRLSVCVCVSAGGPCTAVCVHPVLSGGWGAEASRLGRTPWRSPGLLQRWRQAGGGGAGDAEPGPRCGALFLTRPGSILPCARWRRSADSRALCSYLEHSPSP